MMAGSRDQSRRRRDIGFSRILFVFFFVVLGAGCPLNSILQAQQIEQVSSRRRVQTVAPVYPEIAKKMNLCGKVRIVARVAPSGKVVSAEVLGGHPVLARAASDAVKRWRYEPAPRETNETAVVSFEAADH
jgi:TonB family protein